MSALISYPKSIATDTYCFKINTDDLPCAKLFMLYIKSLGMEATKTRQNSQTKCIAWHVFKIKSPKKIQTFNENVEFAQTLFGNFQKNAVTHFESNPQFLK